RGRARAAEGGVRDPGRDHRDRLLPVLALLRLRPAGGLAAAAAPGAEAPGRTADAARTAPAAEPAERPKALPRAGRRDPEQLRLGGQGEEGRARADRRGHAHPGRAREGQVSGLALLLLSAASAVNPRALEPPQALREVGFDQRLGASLPLDAPFRDEAGRGGRVGGYFGREPVGLDPLFFHCPMLCTLRPSGRLSALLGPALL